MKPIYKKIAIVAVVLIVLALVVWYILRDSDSWTEFSGNDAPGNDIESRSSGTLDADKAYADKIGAKAFVRNLDSKMTFYKSSAETKQSITWARAMLYVKK